MSAALPKTCLAVAAVEWGSRKLPNNQRSLGRLGLQYLYSTFSLAKNMTMADFILRKLRLETDFEAGIRLQEKNSNKPIEGEIKATVLNISREGACLMVSHLFLDRTHIFFSTLGEGTHTLELHQPFSDEASPENGSQPIVARSVWMDRYPHDPEPSFVMGIEFLEPQNKLYQVVKKSLSKKPS